MVGKTDFSDAHNSMKIDHLNVNNASTAPAAGALQFNYVLDSDMFAVADSAGGAAGLALEQTQFSRISGAGSATGTGGACAACSKTGSITPTRFSRSTWRCRRSASASPPPMTGRTLCVARISPARPRSNATASTHNVLINPTYAGNVVNRGPQSTGIEMIGSGNWAQWQFPAAASLHRVRRSTTGPSCPHSTRPGDCAGSQPAGTRRGQRRLVDGVCQRQRQGAQRHRRRPGRSWRAARRCRR